jgi:hypothetical protein
VALECYCDLQLSIPKQFLTGHYLLTKTSIGTEDQILRERKIRAYMFTINSDL